MSLEGMGFQASFIPIVALACIISFICGLLLIKKLKGKCLSVGLCFLIWGGIDVVICIICTCLYYITV